MCSCALAFARFTARVASLSAFAAAVRPAISPVAAAPPAAVGGASCACAASTMDTAVRSFFVKAMWMNSCASGRGG